MSFARHMRAAGGERRSAGLYGRLMRITKVVFGTALLISSAPVGLYAQRAGSSVQKSVIARSDTRELPADQVHFDDELMLALNSVADTARTCLVLHTLSDMGYPGISKLLGIPEGTAMSLVHRTRKALRDRLSPHFRPEPVAAPIRPVEPSVALSPRKPRPPLLKKAA